MRTNFLKGLYVVAFIALAMCFGAMDGIAKTGVHSTVTDVVFVCLAATIVISAVVMSYLYENK